MKSNKFWHRFFWVSKWVDIIMGNPVDAVVDHSMANKFTDENQDNDVYPSLKPVDQAANLQVGITSQATIISYNWALLILIGMFCAPVAVVAIFATAAGIILGLGFAFLVLLAIITPLVIAVMGYLSVRALGKILDKQNVTFANVIAFATLASVGFIFSILQQQFRIGNLAYLSLLSGGVIMPVYILLIYRSKQPSHVKTTFIIIGIILLASTAYIWDFVGVKSAVS